MTKDVTSINNGFNKLKICDFWLRFLLKFVDKLPEKIGERLHSKLINWFKAKRTKVINYYAPLLPVIKYVKRIN